MNYKIFESKEELEQSVPLFGIKKFIVEKVEFCIAQTKEGFFAFENKCPHYSVPLETGNINFKGEVICSLHAYRFNLKNGLETTGKPYCLKRYQILINEDGVFIQLN